MDRSLILVVGVAVLLAIGDLLLKHILIDSVSNPDLGLSIGIGVAPVIVHFSLLIGALVVAWKSIGWQRALLIFLVVVSSSNLYDRLFLGSVRDYLNILGIWFNIADLAIVTAFTTYLIYLVYSEYKTYHLRNRS